MAKAIREITKSIKIRATATGEPVLVRLQSDLATRIDRWRKDEEDLPSRPEAIRRLVEQALAAARKTKK